MRGVSIIGAAMTPFGRHLDKSHTDLAQAAVKAALSDAGAAADDLGMAIYANVIQGFFAGEMSIPGEYALRPLGIQGVRVMHVEAACASSTVGLHIAHDYIRSGLADVVLVVGVEKLYSDDRAKRFAVFQQPLDAEEAGRYLAATKGMLAPTPPGMDGPGPNIMMDASSSGEIVQVEALGLCPVGQGGWAAEQGVTSLGGTIPVNVSGGLVSKGHPLAATGGAQIFELVTQLRGEAGQRQVESARIAIAENSGGFYGVEDGMSAVTILARP